MTALLVIVISLAAAAWTVTALRARGRLRRLLIVLVTALVSPFLTLATSSGQQGQSGAAASTMTQAKPDSAAGLARVCLTDDSIHLADSDALELPATTVFDDAGVLKGKKDEPTSWTYTPSLQDAAIVTIAPITFTRSARCAQVQVKMLLSPLATRAHQDANDNHVFIISDVLDYRIPAQRPSVEIGELVDDIAVKAILISDVTETMQAPAPIEDAASRSAACLAGARQLAAYIGAGIRRQTESVVLIDSAGAEEVSYGCAAGLRAAPDLFVSWEGQPGPAAATLDLIAKGGAYVTGATAAEMTVETQACVSAALKPDAAEAAERQFRGVKLECQAYARDGGGGSVTIYRRFGAAPAREVMTPEARNAMQRASDAAKLADERKAAEALRFARWWQDPAIPEEVKTFAMITARKIALSERCPGWTPSETSMQEAATAAGIEPADLQPGGRYASLMATMLANMRAGTATESVATACEAARKYQ